MIWWFGGLGGWVLACMHVSFGALLGCVVLCCIVLGLGCVYGGALRSNVWALAPGFLFSVGLANLARIRPCHPCHSQREELASFLLFLPSSSSFVSSRLASVKSPDRLIRYWERRAGVLSGHKEGLG